MVAGLLDRAIAAQPAVTRPRITLDFAAGGGGIGGLGGLGDALGGDIGGAAAGLLGLGSGGATLADGLVSLVLRRGVVPHVDVAEFLLTPVPGGPDLPSPADTGRIGFEAADQTAGFASSVEFVESRSRGLVRMTATNGGRVLAQSRIDRSYADQTPGEIIDDIVSQAGVTSSAGGAGETLKRYVADGGRSVLDHVGRLAATAGRLACFNDDGELELIDDTSTGESVATFTAGETLLDFHAIERAEAGTLAVDGDGAPDAGGGEAWAWLRKEAGPMSASGGNGLPQRRIAAPWARSQQAAADLAAAGLRAQGRIAALARFLLPAAPAIVPGAVFTIAGTDTADGSWRALSVVLRFDLRTGMTSEVRAAPVAAGVGLPLGLPALLGGFL